MSHKTLKLVFLTLIIVGIIAGTVFAYARFLRDDGGTKYQAEKFQPMHNWELVYKETTHKSMFNKEVVPETTLAYIDQDTNATRDAFASYVDDLAGFALSQSEPDPSLAQFYYCETEDLAPDDLECSAEFKKDTSEGMFHYRINVYFPENEGSEVWVSISPTSHVGKMQGPGL